MAHLLEHLLFKGTETLGPGTPPPNVRSSYAWMPFRIRSWHWRRKGISPQCPCSEKGSTRWRPRRELMCSPTSSRGSFRRTAAAASTPQRTGSPQLLHGTAGEPCSALVSPRIRPDGQPGVSRVLRREEHRRRRTPATGGDESRRAALRSPHGRGVHYASIRPAGRRLHGRYPTTPASGRGSLLSSLLWAQQRRRHRRRARNRKRLRPFVLPFGRAPSTGPAPESRWREDFQSIHRPRQEFDRGRCPRRCESGGRSSKLRTQTHQPFRSSPGYSPEDARRGYIGAS